MQRLSRASAWGFLRPPSLLNYQTALETERRWASPRSTVRKALVTGLEAALQLRDTARAEELLSLIDAMPAGHRRGFRARPCVFRAASPPPRGRRRRAPLQAGFGPFPRAGDAFLPRGDGARARRVADHSWPIGGGGAAAGRSSGDLRAARRRPLARARHQGRRRGARHGLSRVALGPKRARRQRPRAPRARPRRYRPVPTPRPRRLSSGVPAAMTSPPSSPPSGPRSMIQSAVLMTSRLCSMTTTVLPASTSRAAPRAASRCRRSAGRSSARRGCRASGPSRAFDELGGELHALRLAARERRRRLAELDVAEPDVVQRLQLAGGSSGRSRRSSSASSTVISSMSAIDLPL